ncbi:MAG: MATE family efflux transporter [Psychromonas sp.]
MDNTNIQSNRTVKATFWRYAVPSIIAMMVTGLYQVVDGIFVGHYVGAEGLAAINISLPVIGSLMGLGLMIGMGSGSMLSIFRGENKLQQAQKAIINSLWLILIFALLASVILFFFNNQLITLQGAKDNVFEYAQSYINIFIYGSVLTIGATALPMLVRNNNSPYLATILMVLGAVLNIVLDYILLAIFELGLQGAAIATVISQALIMTLALIYFFSSKAPIKLNLFALVPDYNIAKQSVLLGLSSLFMYLYFSFIIAMHNKLFMQYGTALDVAAFAIIGYLATLYYLFSEGVANGLQPPVSYYFGTKEYQKIQQTVKFAMKIVVFTGFAAYLFLTQYSDLVIGLFISNDSELLQATTNGMRLHLFGMALDGFIFVSSVYFMAVGQGNKALAISIANMAVQIPFLWLLPQWLGINGVWLSAPISNVLLTLVIAPFLYIEIKKLSHKNPLNDEQTLACQL